MKKINIADFPKTLLFTGYYWLSDQQKPVQLSEQIFDIQLLEYQPYVVEGRLYSKENDLSIHIHFIDGKYDIFQMNWREKPTEWETINSTYLAHDLDKVNEIKVTEVWIPANDPNCENMEVLQPAFLGFKGFNYNN
jgi:CRISPR type III-associated protein (TIGR04423 family)